MSVFSDRRIAWALGAAAILALPSIAPAATLAMDTTVAGGWVGIDSSVGSVNGTLSIGGHSEDAAIGRIMLFGQASNMPTGTLLGLPVWCIDVDDWLVNGKFVEQPLSYVTAPSGAGHVTYDAAQLNNVLKFLVYATGQGISDATTSAATQLGIWEILNEGGATPTWNLGSGNFSATQWGGSGATTLANSWLNSSAFASTSTADFSLAILDPGKGNQTQAFLRSTAAVPEPASWLTMILGFGAIGWAMRRRRTVGRAVA